MEREIQRESRKYNSLCNLRFYLFHSKNENQRQSRYIYAYLYRTHMQKSIRTSSYSFLEENHVHPS